MRNLTSLIVMLLIEKLPRSFWILIETIRFAISELFLKKVASLPDESTPSLLNPEIEKMTTCKFYVDNIYLKCAVNPTSKCLDCSEFIHKKL